MKVVKRLPWQDYDEIGRDATGILTYNMCIIEDALVVGAGQTATSRLT